MVAALSSEERIHAEADATEELRAVVLELRQSLADLRSQRAEGD